MTDGQARVAVVRRLLPASPEAVYDEWLDPSALADWMCPRPARCRNVESEPHVGGRLRIDIEDGDAEFYVTGQYLALDRPGRLSFSWSCSTWPDPTVRSVVTVLLEARDSEQTLMTIEHTLLPPGLVDQHARGWQAIAEQLAEVLAALAGRASPEDAGTGTGRIGAPDRRAVDGKVRARSDDRARDPGDRRGPGYRPGHCRGVRGAG